MSSCSLQSDHLFFKSSTRSLASETKPSSFPSLKVTPPSSDLSVSQCIDSEDASKEKRSLCSKFMRLQLSMLDILQFTATFAFFYDSVKFDYNSASSLNRDLKCMQGIISGFVLLLLMFVFLKSMCFSKR